MGPELQAHIAFHLTGKRLGASLKATEGQHLRPALLAQFGDLTRLRYDFPLVLVAGRTDEAGIESLSALVNTALRAVAPRGIEGEATRRHVLRLEREIRVMAAEGETGLLSAIWERAAERIGAPADPALAASLARARAALKLDGDLADCTHDLPSRLVAYAWRGLQQRKSERFAGQLRRLVVKLREILRADFLRSPAGLSADRLKASVGSGMQDAFDFQALSGTLAKAPGREPIAKSRRKRIQQALGVLEAHQAHAPAAWPDDLEACVFGNCHDALGALRLRLPRIVELVRAMSIAEFETEGRYEEATHDPFFADFDEESVGAEDLDLFPDYLVCLESDRLQDPANAGLLQILASEMPIKVVVQVGDVLDESALRTHMGLVAPAAQLARMAMGLGNAYVLQSSNSNLYRARGRILAGLAHPGPALFSVFTGSASDAGELPPYLLAAAAMQSRAFPTFAYDPAAPDGPERFTLEGNPQPEADWPVHELGYEDEACQSVTEPMAFTFVDFAACDPRHARHFAVVPKAQWNGGMVPAGSRLAAGFRAAPGNVPYVQLVNGERTLQRALVDERLVAAAQRVQENWHSLQELGGVRSSQAERVLAQERKAWEEHKQRETEALKRVAKPAAPAATPAPAASAPAVAAGQPAAVEAEPEKPPDEAYIETPRCTTCNECTNLNNRMFAYDANKQAYIADLNAGTFRELVEAAESCQVSIIHPGKPRNPDEPGLAELLKRAEAFH